jgi:hypothetical protein
MTTTPTAATAITIIATIKNTRGVVVLSKTELNNLNIDSLLDGQYIIELKEKNSLYLITLLKQ